MEGTHSSFGRVSRHDTRLLVLGSLPGVESLRRSQYYAHPRNQFWRLMGAVLGTDIQHLPYERRLEALLDAGIGLWDTVAVGRRPRSSLDADLSLIEAAPLASLRQPLPNLRALAFNGKTAAKIGRRQLRGTDDFVLLDLPSSSPAHASLTFEQKRDVWLQLRQHLATGKTDS